MCQDSMTHPIHVIGMRHKYLVLAGHKCSMDVIWKALLVLEMPAHGEIFLSGRVHSGWKERLNL